MPGLWDMHQHLGALPESRIRAARLLASGVTGVRDMGSPLDDIIQLRGDIRSKKTIGPSLYVSGPLLQGPLPFRQAIFISIADIAQVQPTIRNLRAQGVDFVKVQDAVPRAMYFAIASETQRSHLRLAGHIPPTVTAREVVDAGQVSVEHLGGRFFGIAVEASTQAREIQALELGMYQSSIEALGRGEPPPQTNMEAAFIMRLVESYDPSRAADLFARFRAHSTWQCPTLVTIQSLWDGMGAADRNAGAQMFARSKQMVRAMRDAGIPLLAGTDVPAEGPTIALYEELALLVDAGLSPIEALLSATRNAAQFTSRLSEVGTIEKGKLGDLILVAGDPMRDIHDIKRIDLVILGGRVLKPADILAEAR